MRDKSYHNSKEEDGDSYFGALLSFNILNLFCLAGSIKPLPPPLWLNRKRCQPIVLKCIFLNKMIIFLSGAFLQYSIIILVCLAGFIKPLSLLWYKVERRMSVNNFGVFFH